MDDLARIKSKFKKLGITQMQFAEKCGIANATISRIFNGKQPLRPNTKEKFFKALGINQNQTKLMDGVCGFVEFNDKVSKINSFAELSQLTDTIESEIGDEANEIKANGKPLLEELLKKVPDSLKQADKLNVESLHEFLSKNSSIPLVVLGDGSTASPRFAAQMYGMYNGIATAMTPYMANSLSDEALKNSKVLLITNGGSDPDVRYITERLLAINPSNFFVLTSSAERKTRYGKNKRNYVLERMQEKAPDNYSTHDNLFGDGFIAVNSVIFNMSVLYRAFTNENDITDKISIDFLPQSNFTYTLNNPTVEEEYGLPSLKRIKNLVILHGNLSQPIAYDIESKMVEGGIASCQISDYRNFCHGRFIFVSNHVKNVSKASIQSDTAVVLLVTPRESAIVDDLRKNVIPKQMPLVVIESQFDSPLAVIDLEYKSCVFSSEVSNAYKVNINSPQNYAEINKEYPRNKVDFESDFSRYGCLRASWSDKRVNSNDSYDIELKPNRLVCDLNKTNLLCCLGAGEYTFDIVTKRSYPKGYEAQRTYKDEILSQEIGGSCGDTMSILSSFGWETYPIAMFNTAAVGYQMKKDLERFGADTRYVRNDFGDHVVVRKICRQLDASGQPFTKISKLHADGLAHHYPPTPKYLLAQNKEALNFVTEMDVIPNVFFFSVLKASHKVLAQELRKKGTLIYCQINDTEKGMESYIKESDIIQYKSGILNRENEIFSKYTNKLYVEIANDGTIWFKLRDYNWKKIGLQAPKEVDAEFSLGWVSSILLDTLYKDLGEQININSLTISSLELALRKAQEIITQDKFYYSSKAIIHEQKEIAPSDFNFDILRLNENKIKLYKDDEVEMTDITQMKGYGIIGSVLGDIIGRAYEFNKTKDYNFDLFVKDSRFSDDTVMTLAIAKWLMSDNHNEENLVKIMTEFGRKYPDAGFGGRFSLWLASEDHPKSESTGNGSAMRVSPIGYFAKSLDEALALAELSARVSHNTEEGVIGAQSVAAAIFMVRKGHSKEEIKEYIKKKFNYDLDRTTDELKPTYVFEATCGKSVPESIICFLESNTYEATVRKAVSLGGDSDTMACIAGGIASATNTMRVPDDLAIKAFEYLPNEFKNLIIDFTKCTS